MAIWDVLVVTRSGDAVRPLSAPGARRRGAPFVALGLVTIALELAGPGAPSSSAALVAGAALVLVLAVVGAVVPWRRLPAWSESVVPLAFFLVVALARDARGGVAGGYPPLIMLPIIWMALYGTRMQLRAAIVAMAVVLAGPMLVVGPPSYPSSDWAMVVVAIAVGAIAGPAVQAMVEQSRQRTADIAAVGAITRALTTGDDPRPALCEAARLVAGARLAIIVEQGDDGVLAATAGTAGFDIERFRIDPGREPSATAEAWTTGRQVYVQSTRNDPRASPRLNTLMGSLSVLCEPVTRDGKRVAVLVVGFAQERPRLPQHVLDVLGLVAAEIGAALDRAELVDTLAAQAGTDALTGASNRRSWDDELERELASARRSGAPLSVALIDIDRFKAYNDTHGHGAGDVLLQELVVALRRELRPGDVVARWGGEEFAIALPDCDLAQAWVVAQRLLRVVPCEQTISIGLTQAVVADNPRVVIARADRALYLAKEDGRNQARSAVAEPVAVDRVAEPVAPAPTPVRPAQPGRSDPSL